MDRVVSGMSRGSIILWINKESIIDSLVGTVLSVHLYMYTVQVYTSSGYELSGTRTKRLVLVYLSC